MISKTGERVSNHTSSKSYNINLLSESHPTTGTKDAYIGLTLKEYFQLDRPTTRIQEIEQQSNQSLAAETPTFKDERIILATDKCEKLPNRNKSTTLPKEQHLSKANIARINLEAKTLDLDSFVNFEKRPNKFPSIHEQRHTNKSINSVKKEYKAGKRERPQKIKSELSQSINLVIKSNQNYSNLQVIKNSVINNHKNKQKKAFTTFYEFNQKQRVRNRMKTEVQISSRDIEKSFMISRYAGKQFSLKKPNISKQEASVATLRKYQIMLKLSNK